MIIIIFILAQTKEMKEYLEEMEAFEYPTVPPHNRDLSSIIFNINVNIFTFYFLVYRATASPLRKRSYDGPDFDIPDIDSKLIKLILNKIYIFICFSKSIWKWFVNNAIWSCCTLKEKTLSCCSCT